MTERFFARALYALVLAYGISVAGTAMSAVAIPWLVLSTTGSAAQTGIVGFAEMAPYVAVQVLSGPLVDRFGARRGFIKGNLVAAVLVCAIPLLSGVHALSFVALVLLVAFGGAARGWADTASGPLVPLLANRGGVSLERASAMYSGVQRTGMVVGAPLGGLVIAIAGAPVAVLVDGITFAAAALLIALSVRRVPRGEAEPDGYLRSLGQGLRFLGADRLLIGAVVLVAVSNLLEQALFSVLMPVWVRDEVGDPAALGLLGGVSNAGAILGVLIAAGLGARVPRRLTFALGYLLGGCPTFLVLAWTNTLPWPVAVFGLAGVAGGVMNPILGVVLYERVPAELQARVIGAVKASAWIGIPFGSLLGGFLADTFGLTTALTVTGAVMLVASIAPSVFPVWRQLSAKPVA